MLTGLDIEDKADWLRAQLEGRLDAERRRLVDGRPPGAGLRHRGGRLLPAPAAPSRTARQPRSASRSRAAAVELALGSYPGFTMTAPPGPASPFGVYRPAYVDRDRRRAHRAPARRDDRGDRRTRRSRRSPLYRPRPTGRSHRRSMASATTRSPARCRWAHSCTRAPVTRAATPTSASGCARGETAGGAGAVADALRHRRPGPELLPGGGRARHRGLRSCPTCTA